MSARAALRAGDTGADSTVLTLLTGGQDQVGDQGRNLPLSKRKDRSFARAPRRHKAGQATSGVTPSRCWRTRNVKVAQWGSTCRAEAELRSDAQMARWAADAAELRDWTRTKADAAGANLLIAIAEAEVKGDEPRSIDRPVGLCLDLEVPIRQGRQGRCGDNKRRQQETPSKRAHRAAT